MKRLKVLWCLNTGTPNSPTIESLAAGRIFGIEAGWGAGAVRAH